MKVSARCERESAIEAERQVNVDLILGDETTIQFAVDFFLECDDVVEVSYWGFGINGSSNRMLPLCEGEKVPAGELRDFLIREARAAL